MKNRIVTPLFLLMSFLLLTACPPPQELTVYNHTGTDLSVLITERRIEWQAGRALVISDNASVSWEDLQWGNVPQSQMMARVLVVESREGLRRYLLAIPGLPDEYLDSRTGMKKRFLQLEPDGRLYAVKAGATFPVEPLPSQPAGLPIEPVAE